MNVVMTRRLWPLILLTAVLAITALVRTLRAESNRDRMMARPESADEVASSRR